MAMERRKKRCYFSENKIQYIDFKDALLLKRFVTERGKILPAALRVSARGLSVS